MRRGALAMIDALGFKGIWQRENADEVMRKMKALPTAADVIMAGFQHAFSKLSARTVDPHFSYTFLSDTIVVAAWVDGPTQDNKGQAYAEVLLASFVTSAIISAGAMLKPPALAYRGCLAFGNFDVEAPFILGPAVDEAAENMDKADAAIVWMAPSAQAVVDGARKVVGKEMFESSAFFPFIVPMKEESPRSTYAITPLSPGQVKASPEQVRETILKTFEDPRDSVQVKKENTRRFLDAAVEAFVPKPDVPNA